MTALLYVWLPASGPDDVGEWAAESVAHMTAAEVAERVRLRREQGYEVEIRGRSAMAHALEAFARSRF